MLRILAIFLVLSCVRPLYFTIDHRQRCLFEEVTKNTLFKIDFQLMESIPPESLADPSSSKTHGARVLVFSPSDKAILYKLGLANQIGKLSFISEEDGEYRICFEMSAAVNRKLKFQIDAKVGADESGEEKHVQKSIAGALIDKVKRFLHQAKQFKGIQKMNKESENQIFIEQENINFKIFWATMFQILVIVLAGVFQIYTLRKFLIKRQIY